MTPTAPTPLASDDLASLPQFDGFPYLNTRLVPALYHIALLPADAPADTLLRLARLQRDANRLDICLVLGPTRGVFLWADGNVQDSDTPPRGGTVVANGLVLPVDLLHTRELSSRQERLDRMVEEGRRRGRFIVNVSMNGREAAPGELAQLAGVYGDGTPLGLARCPRCLEWRGECLSSGAGRGEAIVPVHCRCENHNRCARCSLPLHERRLNANLYDPADRAVRFVPGFCGLSHKCSAPGNLAVI
jgi:hypothetical protein